MNSKVRSLEGENSRLLSVVSDLTRKVEQMEQLSRSCNIEVQCVPESKTENLLTTLNQLLRTVSCDLPDSSIMSIHRVPKLNSDSVRPRCVIAKLASPMIRDTVLAAVSKYNKTKKSPEDKLSTHDLGLGGTKTPVYVTEHLTPANKKLHAAARSVAKAKGYEYVWIRNGRIFIRKNNEASPLLVKSEEFLKTLT